MSDCQSPGVNTFGALYLSEERARNSNCELSEDWVMELQGEADDGGGIYDWGVVEKKLLKWNPALYTDRCHPNVSPYSPPPPTRFSLGSWKLSFMIVALSDSESTFASGSQERNPELSKHRRNRLLLLFNTPSNTFVLQSGQTLHVNS